MNRSMSIVKAIMVIAGMFASLLTANTFAATDHVNVKVFVADYDGESQTYTGAMQVNDQWRAIGFETDTTTHYEDDLVTDDDSMAMVDLYADGTLKFNANNHTFTFWYLADDSIVSEVQQLETISAALFNGMPVQVSKDTVNGSATLLQYPRNPFTCTVKCAGSFIQNGNLILFVYTIVETETYSVFIPIANN